MGNFNIRDWENLNYTEYYRNKRKKEYDEYMKWREKGRTITYFDFNPFSKKEAACKRYMIQNMITESFDKYYPIYLNNIYTICPNSSE